LPSLVKDAVPTPASPLVRALKPLSTATSSHISVSGGELDGAGRGASQDALQGGGRISSRDRGNRGIFDKAFVRQVKDSFQSNPVMNDCMRPLQVEARSTAWGAASPRRNSTCTVTEDKSAPCFEAVRNNCGAIMKDKGDKYAKEKAGKEERARPEEFGAEAAAVKVLAARLDGSGSDARKALKEFDAYNTTCHGQLAQWGAPGRKGR
jgi:hypothetical protein